MDYNSIYSTLWYALHLSVESFCYLSVDPNNENNIVSEINKGIMTGNRAYFANLKLIKSKALHFPALQNLKSI